MAGKTKTVKVPETLMVDLIGAMHQHAEIWYEKERHHRSINQPDIARNCQQMGAEKEAIANEARQLIGLPPLFVN